MCHDAPAQVKTRLCLAWSEKQEREKEWGSRKHNSACCILLSEQESIKDQQQIKSMKARQEEKEGQGGPGEKDEELSRRCHPLHGLHMLSSHRDNLWLKQCARKEPESPNRLSLKQPHTVP